MEGSKSRRKQSERLIIRPAYPHESPQVKKLFTEVYRDTFGTKVPEFDKVTEGEACYVAARDEEILGFATVWEPDAFIHFLFVDARARHRHIGEKLVDAIAEHCEKPLTLKCLVSNSNAVAFYEATGWEVSGGGNGDEGEYIIFCHMGNCE